MKHYARFGLLFVPLLLAALPDGNDWAIQQLSSPEPKVRIAAARMLSGGKVRKSIPYLVDVFKVEKSAEVRAEIAESLRILTAKEFGDDYDSWKAWWESEGIKLYLKEALQTDDTQKFKEEINKLQYDLKIQTEQMQKLQAEFQKTQEEMKTLSEAKQKLQTETEAKEKAWAEEKKKLGDDLEARERQSADDLRKLKADTDKTTADLKKETEKLRADFKTISEQKQKLELDVTSNIENYLEIRKLSHKDVAVRRSAAVLLAEGTKRGVPYLMDALLTEEDSSVKTAIMAALRKLTEKDIAENVASWKSWWESEGSKDYPKVVLKTEEIQNLKKDILSLKDELANNLRRSEELKKEISDSSTTLTQKIKDEKDNVNREINNKSYLLIALAVVFILIMVYFSAIGYSRLRMWKETIKQADVYIKESGEITKRTAAIIEELEAKRREAVGFFSKLREENTSDIERFCDLLQQKTEHRMREVVMALREKAEQEIAQTLGEWKKNVEYDIRKNASEVREKIEEISKTKEEQFLKNVGVHTMFLDASTYAANGHLDDALKLYKKLLAVKSDHVAAWINLGNILRDLKRYDDAHDAYDKALEFSHDNPRVFYNIAALYAKQRKKEKMLEYLSRSFQNNGEFKDEALNDQDFKDYWNDGAFKDLAEA